LPSVVIVGAGFGGLSAAKKLKNSALHVTVIDKANHHLFQPLLYQVATAGLSPADIAVPVRSILKRQYNTEVMMASVTGINPIEQMVQIENHPPIPYDYLILATGARHSYFGKDNWENFAPGLKTIEDALVMRRKILIHFEKAEVETDPVKRKDLLTFVIVGGGPTGVELAGAIGELAHYALRAEFRHINPHATQIILIEAGPRILSSFPEHMSAKAKAKLEKLGVIVKTNVRVENIDENGVTVGGQVIHAKTVLWAAGVVASPAGKWLNAKTDNAGRVIVEKDLTVPGYPNIFVIGDTARAEQDGKPLPGVSPVAMQQGRYVAKKIVAHSAGKNHKEPFHYLDKGNLATIGRTYAIADLGKIKITGFLAWLLWVLVHIYYLIEFRAKLVVMLEWAWNYLTFKKGARLITLSGPD
jgi:NADH:ubiquinone reductase (H+-translocating)